MNPFARTLLLGACLLLASCTRWHLGDRLRDAHTTYTGVDIFHPVDGKIHHTPAEEGVVASEYYVLAPEVTYQRRSPLTNTDDFYPAPLRAHKIQPTGRTVTARISHGYYFEELVPKLPSGQVSEPAPTENRRIFGITSAAGWQAKGNPQFRTLGILAEKTEEPGLARRALIGTCDYALDPLLNLITIPAEVVGSILSFPILLLAEQLAPAPAPKPQP